ncbi:histidine kinase [Paenibacillus sp.]|jgi:LytS/YehU family sensor histidine kinase|uniref:histidine kinase n=1 Tax=Paenibacillus sp. TaxID=58172 RepID=UPI00281FB1A5|nr:histidine kinase [Paenibacillus sp.]MDR0270850.1 histidine kinase [Paenibacillus sp.]
MFVVIVFLGVLAPIISIVILLMLSLLDHELDVLELENVKVRLEKELQTSRYDQLSEQIQPHFLFNTLNALLSLARMERYRDMTEGMERSASRYFCATGIKGKLIWSRFAPKWSIPTIIWRSSGFASA